MLNQDIIYLTFDYLNGQDAFNLIRVCRNCYILDDFMRRRYPVYCSECKRLGGTGVNKLYKPLNSPLCIDCLNKNYVETNFNLQYAINKNSRLDNALKKSRIVINTKNDGLISKDKIIMEQNMKIDKLREKSTAINRTADELQKLLNNFRRGDKKEVKRSRSRRRKRADSHNYRRGCSCKWCRNKERKMTKRRIRSRTPKKRKRSDTRKKKKSSTSRWHRRSRTSRKKRKHGSELAREKKRERRRDRRS